MKTIYFTLLSVLVFGVVMVSCLKQKKPTEQTEDLQFKIKAMSWKKLESLKVILVFTWINVLVDQS